MIDRLGHDILFALRRFRRAPGFTLIAAITIALGIAANVTVFSFIDELFLKELPVRDPGRLVRISGIRENQNQRQFSYSEYAYLRDHASSVDQLIAHYSTAPLYVTVNGQAGEVQGAVVSANYFPALGVTPFRGRFFTPQEDSAPDRDALAVIGYDLWRSWFAADAEVAGKAIRINGRLFQVVGIAPKNFRGIAVGSSPNEIWIPAMMLRTGYRWCDAIKDDCTTLSVLGRLKMDKSAGEASTEMAALAAQFAATRPGQDVSFGARAMPAIGAQPGGQGELQRVTRLLSITAISLLLIGCVNLAGLLTEQASARTKEIAMRLSLGAARGRILGQLLTESVMLAAVGGALGLALSLWTNQLLIGFYTTDSEGYAQWFDMRLDTRTLVYTLALSLGTGIVFGILPALHCARQDTAAALKGDAGSSTRQIGGRLLVASQIALSMALLVAAGLLARSTANIEGGQAFDPRHVSLLRLRPKLVNYTPDKAHAFQREVTRHLEMLPGVVSLSFTAGDGLTWMQGFPTSLSLPGRAQALPGQERSVNRQQIAPGFFATLRIPLIAGRDFDEHDRVGSPRVTIVSESLARELWPAGPALQNTIIVGGEPYRVVGIAKDSQLPNDTHSMPSMLYVPYWQNATVTDSRMCIRVAGDPETALPQIKAAIARVDPDVPITEAMPMAAQVRGVFSNIRMAKSVLLSMAGLALLLSGIGLYGMLAFVVGRRTREIGIRMAVGAQPGQVMALFLKQGLALAALGCSGGMMLAAATTRLLAAFLYGVPVRDPVSFVAGAMILLGVAAFATYLPARRAARVDPLVALRAE